jgi:hypothetical protein
MIDVNISLKRKHFTVQMNETFSEGITGIMAPADRVKLLSFRL